MADFKMGKEIDRKVIKAFLDVQKEFPFQDYMRYKLHKYVLITQIIKNEISLGSKILDVGCGPCDLAAILSKIGWDLTGVDDFGDPWHLIGNNLERIRKFAKKFDIKLITERIETVHLRENEFDAALLIDVIEHTTTPRNLLNRVISALKPNRLLLIETPNHTALAKRVRLLFGKSVYPEVGFIFFNLGEYRSHIKEYTISELLYMLKSIGLTTLRVKTLNTSVKELLCESKGLKKIFIRMYDLVSQSFPGFRDTILVQGRKPEKWAPLNDLFAIKNLKKYYPHIAKYNLEEENDGKIVSKLFGKRCIVD